MKKIVLTVELLALLALLWLMTQGKRGYDRLYTKLEMRHV